MINPLVKEFEAFEGLSADHVVDEDLMMNNDEDDSAFQPANASQLSSGDVFYEVTTKHVLLMS